MKKKRGREDEVFYSQSLLSKKGPLGVLWLAAHCCRKLRKTHVSQTDIPHSVDKILLAEVPIAFRVLGHLLIGVVRIYAKKVEYLYHDSNEALIIIRDSFASRKVNLSREFRNAPYSSITLPEKFELDAFNLEDLEDVQVCHVKPNEQITLEETWADIAANQFSALGKFHSTETGSCLGFESPIHTLVADVFSPHEMGTDLKSSDLQKMNSFRDSIEILRSYHLPLESDLNLEIFQSGVDSFDTNQHCGEVSLLTEHTVSEDIKFPFGKPEVPTLNFLPHRTPEKLDNKFRSPNASGSIISDAMVIPTPSNKEHCRFSRKRYHFLDEAIVLSNEVLMRGIHNARSLVHTRKKAPHTILDSWKANKISKFSQNFMEPLIPCFSGLFTTDCHRPSKSKSTDEVELETPSSPDQNDVCLVDSVDPLESMQSPESPTASIPNILRFETKPVSRSEELTVSKRPDLWFYLIDEMQETCLNEVDCQNHDRWSARTRAVAHYLCLNFQSQENVLSMACELDGQIRKTCARFFYETLVLKSGGYIDVTQDSPYAEIHLLATSHLEAMF